MNKIANQYGDVLLEKITKLPNGVKQIAINNGYILEKGEGVHTHIFPDVAGIKVYEKDGDTFVVVDKRTKIDHEEHGVQVITPEIYKNRIQQVWDYESKEARRTQD